MIQILYIVVLILQEQQVLEGGDEIDLNVFPHEKIFFEVRFFIIL